MKYILLGFILFLTTQVVAQAPEQFNYQAVLRDASGAIIKNQTVQLRISIHETSSVGFLKYQETHLDTTNSFGLITFQIGKGTVVSGSMSSIIWGNNVHVLIVEMDPTGGTTWERLSTNQLISVPYAMHANTASYAKDEDADTTNELQQLSIIADTLFLSDGGSVVLPSSGGGINNDNDSTNELNSSVSLAGNVLSVTDAGGAKTANLSSLDQSADITGLDARITADSTNLATHTSADQDLSATNEIQVLSISNDTIFLTNGGMAILPASSGGVNNDNDSTNELNSSMTLTGTMLSVTDAGGAKSANLSTLDQSSDITGLDARITADSTNLATHTSADQDLSATNEIQVLSISNDTIFLTNGGMAVLPSSSGVNNDNDSTNELNASISLTGTVLSVTDAGGAKTTDLAALDQSSSITGLDTRITNDSLRLNSVETGAYKDSSSVNEIQVLSISNDTIYLTNGGFAVLPGSSVNNDNDSTNELNSSVSLTGTVLSVTDAGGAKTTDLAALDQSSSITGLDTRITNDSLRLNSVETGAYKDSSSVNEIQVLSISNDTIYLTSGGFAVLPGSSVNNDNDSTNELNASVSLTGTVLSVTDAGGAKTTDLAVLDQSSSITGLNTRITNDSLRLNSVETGAYKDSSSTNEIQVISISSDTVYLTNGGFAVLPGGASNNDNDSTNELNTSVSLTGTVLSVTDAGGAKTTDLAALDQSTIVAGLDSRITADSTALANHSSADNDLDSTNEYIDSVYFSGSKLYISQSNGAFVDSADLSLVNYWNKTGSNSNYKIGQVGIGTGAPAHNLHVQDSLVGKGLHAVANSSNFNTGIEGIANSSSSNNNIMYGVVGTAQGASGTGTGGHYGLFGRAYGAGLTTIGTYGFANGSSSATNSVNRGIEGEAASTSGYWNQGVFGVSNAVNSSAGYNAGIMGAVSGHTLLNYGALTLNTGTGTTNYGGAFFTYGNVSGNKKNYGVYGYTWGADTNIAVYGYSADDATAVNYGVYGRVSGTNSLAGYFIGNVAITGNLAISGSISKGSGTFKIDHPQDPENKMLVHSFVESPDMMNVYNGNITTDNDGLATVQLPDYFESLNMDFRYQLTVVGQFAQAIILEKVDENKFVIKTDKPNVEVSWQVTGIRNDPYSNKNRISPVVEKESKDKGLYLHPEAYGQDESKSMFKPIGDSMNKAKLKELEKSVKSSSNNGE